MIENDLADRGIDIATVAHERSWRWLKTRIGGLLNATPVLEQQPDGSMRPVPSTRLARAVLRA